MAIEVTEITTTSWQLNKRIKLTEVQLNQAENWDHRPWKRRQPRDLNVPVRLFQCQRREAVKAYALSITGANTYQIAKHGDVLPELSFKYMHPQCLPRQLNTNGELEFFLPEIQEGWWVWASGKKDIAKILSIIKKLVKAKQWNTKLIWQFETVNTSCKDALRLIEALHEQKGLVNLEDFGDVAEATGQATTEP